MIEYLFLSAGIAGTGALVYFTAPAGRGLHRYVAPRPRLRADLARLEREADQLSCVVIRLTAENTVLGKERDAANEARAEAEQQITGLEEQLAAFDQLCAENTRLRADLDNARAIRPLPTSDDAPTLPHGIRPVPLGQAPFALGPAPEPS
ncbi:hypothetical protein [Streptomyces sp. NPDC056160]|uniref:hypothetical protein n=1 Tax=Streptomyces sp. NPDC056160 TaxID=3345731 RepID=UPI0035E12D0B